MHPVLIVCAEFYADIAAELERGATEFLRAQQVSYEVVRVPGAFEVPAAISLAIASGRYSGYVALGCVIRGETTHYDYVCTESARGLAELARCNHAAIGYGILTVENEQQAWARARVSEGNKGAGAAQACLVMLALKTTLLS